MKILFFTENLRAGGKERRIVELIKKLNKKDNYKILLVITKNEIHYKEIFELNLSIKVIERKGLKKDPRLFWKFFKITKEFKPDIIHVWGNMVAVYAIPTKIILHIPMINNQITDAPPKFPNTILNHKITFPFSDLIIANSNTGLKVYNSPRKKSMCIYNGFDFDRIKDLKKPEYIRNKFNIHTKYVVGMVATFSELKDYKTYILSALNILELRDDVTFLCVGSGSDSKYRNMVPEKFKLKILFVGRQENVESIINVCDVGVLTTFTEGISNALLEFMALGKPVIANYGGGTKELVENGKNGFLIKPQDSKALAEKIELLIQEDNLRNEMGNSGKEIVANKFDIDRMVEEFEREYRKICAE